MFLLALNNEINIKNLFQHLEKKSPEGIQTISNYDQKTAEML